jgi:hypothetical protein
VIRKDRFTEGFRGDTAAESDVDLVWVVRNNLIKSALNVFSVIPWIRQNLPCAKPLVPNSLTSRCTSCLAKYAATGAV